MELKQLSSLVCQFMKFLLIVPYGIETLIEMFPREVPDKLLIVPYGIETKHTGRNTVEHILLIVPYGIETENRELRKQLGMNF